MVVFTLAIGVMSVCATLKERTPPMNAAAVDVFLIYVDEPSPEILSERDAADEIMGSTPDVWMQKQAGFKTSVGAVQRKQQHQHQQQLQHHHHQI